MLKISLFLVFLGMTACSIKPSLPISLYEETLQSNNRLDNYRACLFLAEIPFQKDNKLETILKEKVSIDDKNQLCYRYIIAKRNLYSSDYDEFIEAIPSGKAQIELWYMHAESGYPISFTPPYIRLLSSQSTQSNKALTKLISVLPYLDASFSENLIGLIAKHYIKQPSKILKALQLAGISQERVDYIIDMSGRI